MALLDELFSARTQRPEASSLDRKQQKVVDSSRPSGGARCVVATLSYMGLPETARADLLVLLEPVGKVRLGMKTQFGGDRLDREVRFAQASPGMRDAPVVEIPGRGVMKERIKKPVEMGDGDTGFPGDALPVQRSFEWPRIEQPQGALDALVGNSEPRGDRAFGDHGIDESLDPVIEPVFQSDIDMEVGHRIWQGVSGVRQMISHEAE